MPVALTETPLTPGEWVAEVTQKDTIYLHHTAGGHVPEGVVSWWDKDRSHGNRVRVGTSYVIGGRSTRAPDTSHDGRILRCFPEEHWAYHLGVNDPGGVLNGKSIGIELCNYGQLVLSQQDGRFYNYVQHPVPDDQVVDLGRPFRGFRYYHKYTDKQLDALRRLMLDIADRHPVDLTKGLKPLLTRQALKMPDGLSVLKQQEWLNRNGFTDYEGKKLKEDGDDGKRTRSARDKVGAWAFEYNEDARAGKPGVWTHTSVRKDKFDCSPQPELLAMLGGV